MFAWFQKVPEQIKLVGDGTALLTSLAALAGHLTSIIGMFGALAALVWGVLRAMNEYKLWKEKRGK